jgi:hypothetical protein
VLLAESFKDAVHAGSRGSSVPDTITWHVADPTRRYIGGFTAEGVDFYGSIITQPKTDDALPLRGQLADAQAQLQSLQPAQIDLTGDSDDATESAVARAVLQQAELQKPSKLPNEAKARGIKRERNESAVHDAAGGGYLDQLEAKLDALQKLALVNGIDFAEIM